MDELALEIWNIALTLMGEMPIESFDEQSKSAETGKRLYPTVLEQEVAKASYNFDKETEILDLFESNITGATQTNPVVITHDFAPSWVALATYTKGDKVTYLENIYYCLKDHTATAVFDDDLANGDWVLTTYYNYRDGDRVWIDDIEGMTEINGNSYIIKVIDDESFSLNDEDGTAYEAYTSGGAVQAQSIGDDVEYLYLKPVNALRVMTVNRNLDFKVNQSVIITREPEAFCEYIANITDETKLPEGFKMLVSRKLSAEACFQITKNAQLSQLAWQQYRNEAIEQKNIDSKEGNAKVYFPDPTLVR